MTAVCPYLVTIKQIQFHILFLLNLQEYSTSKYHNNIEMFEIGNQSFKKLNSFHFNIYSDTYYVNENKHIQHCAYPSALLNHFQPYKFYRLQKSCCPTAFCFSDSTFTHHPICWRFSKNTHAQ